MFLGVMLVTKSSSCVLISWTLLQIVILSCLQEPEIKQNFTYYWCMNSLRHIVDIYEIIDKWNVYKSWLMHGWLDRWIDGFINWLMDGWMDDYGFINEWMND